MISFKESCFLVLDSACGAGSVAVFANGQCLAFLEDAVQGNQAKQLVLMIETALANSGKAYAQLDAIVCTIGPGSFTGIRIALSAARALGLALNKPVIGISTLATLAYDRAPAEVFVNAGKGEVYIQTFDESMRGGEITFAPHREILILPSAKRAGEALLAFPQLAQAPDPLYIRPPDAKIPNMQQHPQF